MSEQLLAAVAIIAAVISLEKIAHLDRLAQEFRNYAQARGRDRARHGGTTTVLSALLGHVDLDKHQRILTTEVTFTLAGLLLSLLCLLGVVVIVSA